MATSTAFDFNPSCAQILRMALQSAGMLAIGREPTAMQFEHGRFFLDAWLKSQNTKGAALMQMERATLSLVGGTDAYELAADTIEVEFPMMQSSVAQTSQTQITQMVYTQYQETTDKAQQGTPIRCYAEKLATVTLRFWPVPDKVYTVSYRRQRLVRNAESGTTLDLTQRWIRGVAFQLAADMALAGSMDLKRVDYLQKLADGLLARAEGFENEGGDVQCILEMD